jgi:hypothetical protein
MCLVISMVLMTFGINMLMHGDIVMGLGSVLASLFFMTMMVRHFLRVKKERGSLNAKDCLTCNSGLPIEDEKENRE